MHKINLTKKLCGLLPRSGDSARNAKNAFFSTADFTVNAVILVLATPVYLKGLGVELFGVWVLVNTVLGMGGMFSFGMGQATLKFVSKYSALGDTEQVKATIRGTWGIYLGLGIFGGSLIALLSPLLFSHLFKVDSSYETVAAQALAFAGIGLPVIFSNNVFDCSLKGFERYDYASNANIVVNVLRHSLQVCAILLGFSLIALVGIAILSQLIGLGIKVFVVRRKLLPGLIVLPTFTHAHYREIFSFSFYSWLSNLMGVARNNGDRLIIASMLGASAVGYYDIAQRILVQVYNVTSRAFGYLFPYASRMYEQGDMKKLRESYDRATAIISVLSVAMILPLFVYAHDILRVWLGEDAAVQAGLLMQILAVRFALYPLSIVNTYFLYGSNKVKAFAWVQAVSTVFMLLAIAFFTHRYGLIGAGIGQCCVIFVILFNRAYIENTIFRNWSLPRHVRALALVLTPLLLAANFLEVSTSSELTELFFFMAVVSLIGLITTGLLNLLFDYLFASQRYG